MAFTTIHEVTVGRRVVFFEPLMEGTIEDVDYCSIKIRWDDGLSSILRKADGFVGWGVLQSANAGEPQPAHDSPEEHQQNETEK